MLKFAVVIVSSGILLAAHTLAAPANDYLSRGWSEEPLHSDLEYDRTLQRVLHRAFRPDVMVRTVMLPPFAPENIIGIIRSPEGYFAFDLRPSAQIWEALHEKKGTLPAIRAIERQRRIAPHLATRLLRVWRHVLADRRNYGSQEKGVIFMDSTYFIFHVAPIGGSSLTANTHRFEEGTNSAALILLGDAVYRYVRRGMSEGAIESRIRAAEAKVGLSGTEASNQAMQLTANKPGVYASGVCRRERMLRGMRRGLAAADLVAR